MWELLPSFVHSVIHLLKDFKTKVLSFHGVKNALYLEYIHFNSGQCFFFKFYYNCNISANRLDFT